MTVNDTSFDTWFSALTLYDFPRMWQRELASEISCRDRVIRIPTGMGKTEGVLSAWSFHRICRQDDQWPRRLVWCLPMRVLVEQTVEVAKNLASRIATESRPEVCTVMGGEDLGEWFLYPERSAILIGTQDMLLSRAMNRGYGGKRARWPMEFGLVNQDSLWVMDEVQLMDVGLATSAQLQAFRYEDRQKGLRPCHTWWMSATLQPEWLRSVDTSRFHDNWIRDPCIVSRMERSGGLWEIRKSLATEVIGPQENSVFAQRILEEHGRLSPGEFGKITLVVCNTVARACSAFDALKSAGRTNGIELVHSRFRSAEREEWRERFLSRSACGPEVDRVIVSTQVIEAGVDVSAGCLISELAPWPSMVQRFGRCARYGGNGKVIVVDRGRDDACAAPYAPDELECAWESLQQLENVGISTLEAYEDSLTNEARRRLYPYSPAHLLLRKEFDELFDTTPDLTGADLDISRFIRSGDERDLQVFWLDLAKDKTPSPKRQPHRRELCTVPFLKARDWLCGKETRTIRKPRLRSGMRAWVWDWIDGKWVETVRASLLPGRIVCVAASSGGYRTDRGFDPDFDEKVSPITSSPIPPEILALDEADDQQDGEQLSFNPWKTIACHTGEVANEASKIARRLGLPADLSEIVEQSALWHDWGKSHPAFQGAIRGSNRPARVDLAKGPESAWRRPPDIYRYLDDSETRPAFRHELAGALGLFAILQLYAPKHPALLGPWSELAGVVQEKLGFTPSTVEPLTEQSSLIERLVKCDREAFDLLAYLVASHHGKVRVGLHAAPRDQEYRDRDGRGLPIRGIREGDRLPAVVLVADDPPVPEVTLTLSPAAVGLSCRTGVSWRERCIGLLERHGPAALAFLEAILRAADVRGSRLKSNDQTIASEVGI